MEKSDGILNDYDSNLHLYKECERKFEILINELLKENGIKSHQVTSRVKEKDKLDKKIKRKEQKYDKISDVTDVVGLRIITYFEDEVDKVAKVIEKEFEIDKENSIDKRKLEVDRFGYKSLHYVVTLNSPRCDLGEYKKLKGTKVEIQIRSILQHAWAEIEHDIGYLDAIGIPEFAKRDFSRIAALLETADKDFVELKNVLLNYENNIENRIKHSPEEVQIDAASLKSYIIKSKEVKDIDHEIAKKLNAHFGPEVFGQSITFLIGKLKFMGIKTIKQLDELLIQNKEDTIKFAVHYLSKRGEEFFLANGISIFYLQYLLATKKKDSEYLKKLCRSPETPGEVIDDQEIEEWAKSLMDTYEKIKGES